MSLVRPTFRQIFDDHFDYVWSSLRRLGVGRGDLEDVADEVFLRVHERFDRYDPSRPIRPWLFAFAFHAASDYRRLARHRLILGVGDDDLVSTAPNPEEDAARREDVRLVYEALGPMSLEIRSVFVMYEIDGHDMKEIAEALGIPANTAYSRLRLARRAFEAKIRELRGEPAHDEGAAPPSDMDVEVEAGR